MARSKPQTLPENGDWVYSRRHREYDGAGGDHGGDLNWQVPATDIDFIECPGGWVADAWEEFDRHRPVAIIDTKTTVVFSTHHASVKALKIMADKLEVPFLLSGHCPVCEEWRVIPWNDRAHALDVPSGPISEIEWVRILYRLRRRKLRSETEDWIVSNPVVTRPWYLEGIAKR